jgi:hypothetical protein
MDVAYFKALSEILPGGGEDNHDEPQLGYPSFGPRTKSTSRMFGI